MRIKEQLNPGYPVRIKRIRLGNQDQWDSFILRLLADSYFHTRTLDQYNIQQAFQALHTYEYVHVQEHQEKYELRRPPLDFLMGFTRFYCNLYIVFILYILSKKKIPMRSNYDALLFVTGELRIGES